MNRWTWTAALMTLVLLVTFVALRAAEKPKKSDQPVSALIVVEGIISRQGVGEMKAIRVVDRKKLSSLESFFPNYRKRPSSNIAGAWKAGYRVYFNFPGSTVFYV